MRLVEPDSGPLQYTEPKWDPPPIFHAVYRQEQAETYGPRPVLHPGQTDCKEAIDVVTIVRMNGGGQGAQESGGVSHRGEAPAAFSMEHENEAGRSGKGSAQEQEKWYGRIEDRRGGTVMKRCTYGKAEETKARSGPNRKRGGEAEGGGKKTQHGVKSENRRRVFHTQIPGMPYDPRHVRRLRSLDLCSCVSTR